MSSNNWVISYQPCSNRWNNWVMLLGQLELGHFCPTFWLFSPNHLLHVFTRWNVKNKLGRCNWANVSRATLLYNNRGVAVEWICHRMPHIMVRIGRISDWVHFSWLKVGYFLFIQHWVNHAKSLIYPTVGCRGVDLYPWLGDDRCQNIFGNGSKQPRGRSVWQVAPPPFHVTFFKSPSIKITCQRI